MFFCLVQDLDHPVGKRRWLILRQYGSVRNRPEVGIGSRIHFGPVREDATSCGEGTGLAPAVAVIEDADDETVLKLHGGCCRARGVPADWIGFRVDIGFVRRRRRNKWVAATP